MSARKVKCQFFSLFFFPNRTNLSTILMVAWKKKQKNVSFYGICMYVRPSFFCFLCTLPLGKGAKKTKKKPSMMDLCMYV